jgi:hypothetical protein
VVNCQPARRPADQKVVGGHTEDRGLSPIELWDERGYGVRHRCVDLTGRPLSPKQALTVVLLRLTGRRPRGRTVAVVI